MVAMKNRILTNARRTIRRNLPRFVSLMTMSFLGVFVFVGLQATTPDMMRALDDYLDAHRQYDLRVVSTMGLTEEDVTALSALPETAGAQGYRQSDGEFTHGEDHYVLRVQSLPQSLCTVDLISGKQPGKNEIAVEQNLLDKTGLAVGDSIALSTDKLSGDFRITGVVRSSLYFNSVKLNANRGNTNVGAGIVNFYAYTAEASFTSDYFDGIYLTATGALAEQTGSEAYLAAVDAAETAVCSLAQSRCTARLKEIQNEAYQTLSDEKKKAFDKLDAAKEELEDSKAALDAAAATLEESRQTLEEQRTQLQNAEAQIENAEKTLAAQQPDAATMAALKAAAEAGSQQAVQTLSALQNAKNALSEQKAQLQSGRTALERGEQSYQTGRAQYNENLEKYQSGWVDYQKNRQKAEEKFAQKAKEIEDIEAPKWLYYDRTDDATYRDYLDDTASVENLSAIFPVIFFLVAVLVSLISMNRFVQEDRSEIGALKSMGFDNRRILTKYLLFAFSATMIGGLAGGLSGGVIIPLLISNIYGMLFTLPRITLSVHVLFTALGLGVSMLCVCGTTVLTVNRVLRERPGQLLRPKAPPAGKRVLPEKIGFLWKRLTFSQKVTLRNLFRYKKRVLVTVGGIMGCTALILCGFGIKDAIVDLTEYQYGGVFTFDGISYVSEYDKADFALPQIKDFSAAENLSVQQDRFTLTLFASDQTEGIVRFTDVESDQVLPLPDDGVLITEKYAALSGISTGDTVTVADTDGKQYTFTVRGVVKCYLGHYLFMSPEVFESAGGTYSPNAVYFHTVDQENLEQKLLSSDHIISVSLISTLTRSVDDMLTSLNKVVLILIVLASLLAFVVLYNLSSINITERKREIATLKVLGFYDREVDAFITRENILLTAIGILLGWLGGYFLTHAVIRTVEIEKARFIRHISPQSFLYAALLSITFTLIVNIITHFSLKRIDMIESLKSVE